MSDCCDPVPYRRFFNTKEANRRMSSYLKRGLDPLAKRVVAYLTGRGVEGLSVLEVGGGVGDLQAELLSDGASRALNIELSDAYQPVAEELADERGLADRMSRRFGDFVEIADELEPADVVVLNRVVCCYPFMERMVRAAASKSGRYLALVFPKDRFYTRMFIRFGNALMAVRKCDFRAFVHPVGEIERVAAEDGLEVVHRDGTWFWQAIVWERPASSEAAA